MISLRRVPTQLGKNVTGKKFATRKLKTGCTSVHIVLVWTSMESAMATQNEVRSDFLSRFNLHRKIEDEVNTIKQFCSNFLRIITK